MTYTIYECPECGYWHGAADGLWSAPRGCPRCIDRLRTPGERRQNVTTGRTVRAAPTTVAVALAPEERR